ncbi:flavin reductase family protein [Paenibacillus wulumuqiensis]|uniref:flavin reductase family protein n=1 Tax=Paenibacillus wulumuqiensis TaxID=1567107 RepID=UPI0006193035|nr:flavin reductase family protein [Paenibacillus wulumuqiensis]
MHQTIDPSMLYFGTPVVLISTLNEDGTPNLAPISSIWWLNHSCMIGMSSRSQTMLNLQREQQCVLNLPSADQVHAVDRLALTTGRTPVPEYKAAMGYIHEPDKFTSAGLHPLQADQVNAPRVQECPVQMEAVVEQIHAFDNKGTGHINAVELRIAKVHIEESLLTPPRNHINPDRWKPLMMSFCEFYTLGEKLHPSRLAAPFMNSHD